MPKNAIARLAATALLSIAGAVTGQVEVLSQQQLSAYQQRLPAVIESVTSDGMKAHLQSLPGADGLAIANAVRVATDAPAAQSLVVYSVPAMSPVMRLADAYPLDGRVGATVGVVLAKEEYEPASFVIYALKDFDRVTLTVGDLKSDDGAVFPSDALDLKVVKVWYQGGNGWFSYFTDVGLELVPELLLKDESLIRVDTKSPANYARTGSGETWISAPFKLDAGFDPYAPGFADAATLQPVALKSGQFKQFVLTAHATRETKPGLYRGTIEVATGAQATEKIKVAVRVLPFELPLPKSGWDVQRDFVVTLMGAWPRVGVDHPAFMPTLRNLRAHNILHLGPNVGPSTPTELATRNVQAMKDAGFQTRPIIGGTLPGWVGTHDGTPLTFDDLMTVRRAAIAWREFFLKHFGHTDASVSHGDEQAAAWVVKTRPLWRILHEQGLKSNLAGHGHIFEKAGYAMDIHPTAGTPADAGKARVWHEVGPGYVGFYASQHNGSENPEFVRRQHGLLGYLSGFDMVNNYEFAYGPWNDRAIELYKPMVLAYPTSNGLVDTLAWEGFREGIDDIRYATKLRQLAQEAVDSRNLDRIYAGRQAKQWLALMDGTTVDLNTVRLEMIQKITRLMELAEKQTP